MPPDLDVHIIMDNYATHKTALVRSWLARRPHYHVHFTPTSASWINQVERWFAELTRKQLRRGVHTSTSKLEADIRAFIDAGCRYLQLDEVNFTYLCDPKLRAFVANRGEDPETLPHVYARMINAALSDVAPDMTRAMHLCRGNFQSTFVASGGYEPVAEILFNEINIDAYFMEYDSDRAGGFAPLRFVPKGKMVVLGLVTSKSGALESKDELKRRIDQAARFIDLDQLCLSPQCGFASTEEGNILAEDEQWAKLRRIVEVAEEVWG